MNHEKALEMLEIDPSGKEKTELKKEIQTCKDIKRFVTSFSPKIGELSEEETDIVKNQWIHNKFNLHTKQRFCEFIELVKKMPFYGVSLFWGEVYKIKE